MPRGIESGAAGGPHRRPAPDVDRGGRRAGTPRTRRTCRPRWSRCSAPPPRATSPTSPTYTRGTVADSAFVGMLAGRGRPASGFHPARRDQRGAARCDRARIGACDERRAITSTTRCGRHDGRRVRRIPRDPSARSDPSNLAYDPASVAPPRRPRAGAADRCGSSPGGSGAGWYEAAELLAAAVRHGVRIPLAEHDLLACWLLEAAAGCPRRRGADGVPARRADGIGGGVPWAAARRPDRARVERRMVDSSGRRCRTESLDITPGANMIGEPRDTVTADLDTLQGAPVSAERIEELRRKSALVRSIQVCAALDRILELSIEHTTSRYPVRSPAVEIPDGTEPDLRHRRRGRARPGGDRGRADRGRHQRLVWRPTSISLSRWHVRARATPHRWWCETPTRCTAPSAPPVSTGSTNSPGPRWPGVRSSDQLQHWDGQVDRRRAARGRSAGCGA